jgi:ribose-phosphate pyrophosphokinase
MVRNIVVIGGNSHPELVERICSILNVPPCNRILNKFSSGESRCEIYDSVRGKDVYIVQTGSSGGVPTTGGDKVNDHLMELCIMVSACKIGSAKRITAVIPHFPYSRQPDIPYNKAGAPLAGQAILQGAGAGGDAPKRDYTFESVPPTPGPHSRTGVGIEGLSQRLVKATSTPESSAAKARAGHNYTNSTSVPEQSWPATPQLPPPAAAASTDRKLVQANPGYKQWIAQPGTLIASLLECAGANHIVTMDLHTSVYQGFFDVPVDNLYGKALLKRYIQTNIPNYQQAVIVSPDAGGAKRATDLADTLNMDFALIHKERRPIKYPTEPPNGTRTPTSSGPAPGGNPTMMLVGNIKNRMCIIVDDMVDTANTITRAAKLLKREGADAVYALLTHGVLSGDAIPRINASALDRVVVTNTVPQDEHRKLCPKLEVLEVAPLFSEAIRRAHHGESLSALFQYT